MKLYQTTADAPGTESGVTVVWSGSAADASKQRTAFKKEGLKGVSTEDVDIPTNKAELLDFLNANAVVAV